MKERAEPIWVYAFISMLPWSPLRYCMGFVLLKDDQRHRRESADDLVFLPIMDLLAPMLLFSFLGNILQATGASIGLNGAIVGSPCTTKDHYQRGYTKSVR